MTPIISRQSWRHHGTTIASVAFATMNPRDRGVALSPSPHRMQRLSNTLSRLLPSRAEPLTVRRVGRAIRRRTNRLESTLRARLYPTTVWLPKPAVATGPVARPDLRVGVILDEFSELAFTYEWSQFRLSPDNWRQEMADHKPSLVFVESAWRGNGGDWQGAMTGAGARADALRELLANCHQAKIPTVFWNKEDPPNYARFIETARLFDHVFTVDADMIPTYIKALGHDRVDVLPFAAQPRIHNPIRHGQESVERPHDVAFAGTYFAEKHPERRQQMDLLLGAAAPHGLHIFSRMQTQDSRYRFPAKYSHLIKGSLGYRQMVAAYSAYKVFLNVNSVVDSPTMCPRRLFELSAAQTAVVSTPAASIERFFGKDITVVDNQQDADEQLGNLIMHKELRDRQVLRAHRTVHDQHLYRHRVDKILDTVGLPRSPFDDSVSAIVPTMRPQQLENVWEFLHRQSHPRLELVLVSHGFSPSDKLVAELQARWPLRTVTLREADPDALLGDLMNLGVEAASGRYVAKMDDDNYYAEHYLSDLIRAFSWTDAQVVGKWAHYVHIGDDTGPTLLRFAAAEHRFVRLVQGGTIVTPREVARESRFESLPRKVDTTFLDKIRTAGGRVYSSDRFNFVSNRSTDAAGHTWGVSTSHLLAHSSTLEFYGSAVACATN